MTEDKHCTISIVIPAYNEQASLDLTLKTILEWEPLSNTTLSEIIIVDDGSDDSTVSIVQNWQNKDARVKLLPNEHNQGKGYSVRRGIIAASGDIVGFSDADLTYHTGYFNPLIERILDNKADVAVGSRKLSSNSSKQNNKYVRRITSTGFQKLINCLGLKTTTDSQCGLKFFSGDVIRKVFPRLRCDGFAFDVELLHLCQRDGFRLIELPVQMKKQYKSSIRLHRQIPIMLLQLLRIRFRRY